MPAPCTSNPALALSSLCVTCVSRSVRFALRPDGVVAVEVHQTVCQLDGTVVSDGRVVHAYRLRDGLIERMDVEDDDT